MATVSNLKKPNEPPSPRPTTFARVRLILIACVLAGWLGWLAYLVAISSHPIVLAEPQFLMSTVDVVADVKAGPDGQAAAEVQVREVHYPKVAADALIGKSITVSNLPKATKTTGWKGAGRYILPLVRDGDNYRVAVIPYSAGYHPDEKVAKLPHIYPATSETLRELDQMPKPEPAPKK